MRVTPLDIVVRAQSMFNLRHADKELLKELFWPSKESIQQYATVNGKDWRMEYTRSRLGTLWPALIVSAGIAAATCSAYSGLQGYQAPAATTADTLEMKVDTGYVR